MKTRRFFLPFSLSGKKELLVADWPTFNRLKNVLRIEPGEEINVFNSREGEYRARVNLLSKEKIVLEILEKKENKSEPEIKVNLFQSVIKKDKFEWVVEKSTEAGVSSITPIITQRTVKTNLNFERLKKIAQEATEQSGRILVPQINEILDFEDLMKKKSLSLKNNSFSFLLDFSGKPIREVISKIKKFEEVNFFVGPEGGFSEEEISLAKNEGVEILSFGPRIFRSETIGAVVTAFILNV